MPTPRKRGRAGQRDRKRRLERTKGLCELCLDDGRTSIARGFRPAEWHALLERERLDEDDAEEARVAEPVDRRAFTDETE